MAAVFAYAQARLQARLAMHPPESVWELLQAQVELPALLEQTRLTPLRHWIANITASSAPHEAERLLRAHLRTLIADAAHWVPGQWRGALLWTQVLIDLPALNALLRGEPAHGWMQEEPLLRDLAMLEPALRERALAQGPLAALAARAQDQSLLIAWLKEWRRRWPRGRAQTAALNDLIKLVQRHRDVFTTSATAAGAWSARRALETRVRHVLRRAFLSPVAVFAWLLLAALEAERLRAELASRFNFSAGSG